MINPASINSTNCELVLGSSTNIGDKAPELAFMNPDSTKVLKLSDLRGKVWIAAGHGMLGISMSTATGQLMADLMTGRPPAFDPSPYRPERFA